MTQEDVVARVIDALDRLGVVYMVAGSFASNFHGVPRMTQDADLIVDLDEAGAERLVRDLESDFYVSEDAAREAVRLRRLFNAIHLATGFKVDLVVKKDRPFSAAELARRTRGQLAGRPVSFGAPGTPSSPSSSGRRRRAGPSVPTRRASSRSSTPPSWAYPSTGDLSVRELSTAPAAAIRPRLLDPV